jgi:hypothetical protein
MATPDFLDGCVPARQFASTVGKTYRTLHNWMAAPDGLPYLQLGRDRYIHVETAREWLFGRRTIRRNPLRASRAKAPPITRRPRRLSPTDATI